MDTGNASCFGQDHDLYYMNAALDQARQAAAVGEVPIGAVVVNGVGEIVGQGYNRVMALSSQAAHAEMDALAMAGKTRGDWRLNGCWLYVTLEPCMMCMGLARLSRIDGIVYGASSPLFGYATDRLDKECDVQVYKKDIALVADIKKDEALQLLRQFFKEKRRKDEHAAD